MTVKLIKSNNSGPIITYLTLMLATVMLIGAIFIIQSILNTSAVSALGSLDPAKSEALVNNVFPQNNITGWNPLECSTKGGASSGSCFKIDDSVGAQDFWYAEGCLSKCKSSSYAHTVYDSENPSLRNDTESDEELGGMLYIYADNYDIDYDSGYGKLTPNGGNSTQKYYWVVLPDQAYSNGFGETYVATFENTNEPVYFITFDVHACPHQSEDYCGKAGADANGVQAGREFLGAITDTGSPTEAANILGKLKSLCRINGRGEVTAAHDASNASATTSKNTLNPSSSSSTGSSSSSSSGGGDCNFTKYDYSDDDLRKLAAIAASENGGTIEALKNEMSLMANLFESGRGSGYSSVLDYVINGGWFGSSKGSISGDSASDEQFEAAKDVFNNGNRTLPPEVDEHDCIDCGSYGFDITSIEVNGNTITDSAGLLNSDNYIKNETILHNKYSATYTFYTWADPDSPVNSDPMGYTGDSISCDPNGTCTTYEGDYPQYTQQTGYTCGPTSMAMLATVASGQDVSEADVISIVGSDRAYANTVGSGMVSLDQKVGEKYGFTVEQVDVSEGNISDVISKMKEYLNNGYMIHYSGCGGQISSGCHYVGIFKLDGDQALLADSSSRGNREVNIDEFVGSAYHGDAFSAIKVGGSSGKCSDLCQSGSDDTIGNGNVLAAVEAIIELANQNGSTYMTDGYNRSQADFDAILEGKKSVDLDCTGFASLVMYKAFGQMTLFSSESIFSDPLYEEVDRANVKPGDVFAYNSPQGHGGIVVEVSNGEVTKIAETNRGSGEGTKNPPNTNIGYSGADDYSVKNINGPNGHFFRWKGN